MLSLVFRELERDRYLFVLERDDDGFIEGYEAGLSSRVFTRAELEKLKACGISVTTYVPGGMPTPL